jgi:hypothetical protein
MGASALFGKSPQAYDPSSSCLAIPFFHNDQRERGEKFSTLAFCSLFTTTRQAAGCLTRVMGHHHYHHWWSLDPVGFSSSFEPAQEPREPALEPLEEPQEHHCNTWMLLSLYNQRNQTERINQVDHTNLVPHKYKGSLFEDKPRCKD